MIQAHSLHQSFGGFQALNGLTFSVADGAITGNERRCKQPDFPFHFQHYMLVQHFRHGLW